MENRPFRLGVTGSRKFFHYPLFMELMMDIYKGKTHIPTDLQLILLEGTGTNILAQTFASKHNTDYIVLKKNARFGSQAAYIRFEKFMREIDGLLLIEPYEEKLLMKMYLLAEEQRMPLWLVHYNKGNLSIV